jgi:hypothetical protein
MTLRSDDLDARVPADERATLAGVAARIERERPLPAVVFQGGLRRQLERLARRRRRFAVGCLTAGAGLLGVAAIGLTGFGPLAPDAVGEIVAEVISLT